jgi:The GLUG motif
VSPTNYVISHTKRRKSKRPLSRWRQALRIVKEDNDGVDLLTLKLRQAIGLALVTTLLASCGKFFGLAPGAAGGTNQVQSGQAIVLPCNLAGSPFGDGTGDSTDPYVICTLAQFQNAMNTQYSGDSFILATSFDLTSVALSSFANFTGTFNGNNQTLTNFGSNQPLFVLNSGLIENLLMTQANMALSGQGGILVGTNLGNGKLVNDIVLGTISTTNASGGLAGVNEGVIQHCSANVAITGVDLLGGLVGVNQGSITTSYALGSVAAPTTTTNPNDQVTGMYIGGLVGQSSSGSITNSYSQASATGRDYVGGLIGNNGSSNLSNTYATGTLTSPGIHIGGIVGANATGTAISSYWDEQTTTMTVSTLGLGEFTSEAQSQSTFVGWDFTNVWEISGQQYPTLR